MLTIHLHLILQFKKACHKNTSPCPLIMFDLKLWLFSVTHPSTCSVPQLTINSYVTSWCFLTTHITWSEIQWEDFNDQWTVSLHILEATYRWTGLLANWGSVPNRNSDFLSSVISRLALEPTQPSIQRTWGVLFQDNVAKIWSWPLKSISLQVGSKCAQLYLHSPIHFIVACSLIKSCIKITSALTLCCEADHKVVGKSVDDSFGAQSNIQLETLGKGYKLRINEWLLTL
jgi:hypothetical protein